MTDYDRYVERMQKISNRIPAIKMFLRILLGGVCIAAIVGIIILLRIGTFTDEVSCDSIVYGEELKYSAKAYRADVEYFFAEEGKDLWSSTVPYMAGRYTVKAVAENIWKKQNESYCDFEIHVRDLKAEYVCEDIEYDSTPVCRLQFDNLAEGDSIEDYKADYVLPEGVGTGHYIGLGNGDVKVVNKKNEDVSGCYNIVSGDASFEVFKKNVAIAAGTVYFEYDGKEHFCEEFEEKSGSIGVGKYWDVTCEGSATFPGTAETNITSYRILDAEGSDITEYYNVTTCPGILYISKRAITVDVKDIEKIYDAKPAEGVEYEIIRGTLLDGDRLVCEVGTGPVLAGSEAIDEKFFVYREQEDVSDYYEITVVQGTYTIKKRPITIRTADATKVYDGTELSKAKFEITEGTLCKGHSINIDEADTVITYAGSVENRMTVSIRDPEGTDWTSNYEITYEYGKLTVEKRKIELKSRDAVGEYTGRAFMDIVVEVTKGSLAPNEDLYVKADSNAIYPGIYENSFTARTGDELNDTTSNYDVSTSFGTLEILAPENDEQESGDGGENGDGEGSSEDSSDDAGEDNSSDDGSDDGSEGDSGEGDSGEGGSGEGGSGEGDSGEGGSGEGGSDDGSGEGSSESGGEYGNGGHGGGGGDNMGDYRDDYTGWFDDFIENGFGTPGYYDMNLLDDRILRNSSELQDGQGVLFMVKSERTQYQYIRAISKGSYFYDHWEGTERWLDAAIYPQSEEIRPLRMVADLLGEYDVSSYKVSIALPDYTAFDSNLMPYYARYDQPLSENDVEVLFSGQGIYTFDVSDASLQSIQRIAKEALKSNDSEGEDDYYNYVCNKYLAISPDIKRTVELIIAREGLDKSSGSIIEDVAEYMRNFGTYNIHFEDYPDTADVNSVIYFLTKSKEGMCQHYASAATFIYRALGIPARYTMGYLASCSANAWCAVTTSDAHAWVEVYLADIGWVPVEVTPSDDGNKAVEYRKDDLAFHRKITVQLLDATRYFNMQPFESSDVKITYGYLDSGDVLICESTAKETYVGKYLNDFVYCGVYDKNRNDVSDKYDIELIPGYLEILPLTLTGPSELALTERIDWLDLSDYVWNQSGLEVLPNFKKEPITLAMDVFDIEDGNLIGNHTGLGYMRASYDNIDYNGDGVYEIEGDRGRSIKIKVNVFSNIMMMHMDTETAVREGRLKISRKFKFDNSRITLADYWGEEYNVLDVAMGSATKEYDGTVLTCDDVVIINGELRPGDHFEAIGSGSIVYAGSTVNSCKDMRVINAEGKDVTSNYRISVYDGELTVETCKVLTDNLEYRIPVMQSVLTEDVFANVAEKMENCSVEQLDDESVIKFKNGALSALKKGKSTLRGNKPEDINGDGVYEYDRTAVVTVIVETGAWKRALEIALVLVVCGAAVAYFVRKNMRDADKSAAGGKHPAK